MLDICLNFFNLTSLIFCYFSAVVSQAFETRNTLGSQRSSLSGANSGLAGIASNIPSFGRLIDGIQRKKYKESLVVAMFVAVLICFTLWWLLR